MPRIITSLIFILLSLPVRFPASNRSQSALNGRWLLTLEDDARRIEMPVDLRLEPNGRVRLILLGKTGGEPGLFEGAMADNRMLATGRFWRLPAEINLTLQGDRAAGRLTSAQVQMEIYGTRTPAAEPEVTPDRYDLLLGAVLTGVRQHFYDRALGGLKLDELRARHLRKIKAARSDGDLALAIRQLLAEFRSSHLEFHLATGKPPVVYKQEPVLWLKLEAGVGYLALLQFPASDPRLYDGLLSRAMAQAVQHPALVIDLRGNRGDRLETALGALNLILPEGRPIASVASRVALERLKLASIERLDPATLPSAYVDDSLGTSKFQGAGTYLAGGKFKTPYRGKMVVLVDEGCQGSCELFAAAMQESRAATLIGQPTRGALLLSIPVNFTLVGWAGFPRNPVRGWQLEAPTAEVRTAAGNRIEARGVQPDLPVERTPTGDAPLARALEWLAAQRRP
jgi:Peptidase family S41/Tricorn protease C1 domain